MSANRIQRLSAYAGAATAATVGGVLGGEASADVVIFDIGVTINASLSSLPSSATITATQYIVDLAPFNHGIGFGLIDKSAPMGTGGSSAGDWASIDLQFGLAGAESGGEGNVQIAKKLDFGLKDYEAGGSVDPYLVPTYWGNFGVGVKDKEGVQNDGEEVNWDKGLDDGVNYIGFRVTDSEEDDTWHYGWVELEFATDDDGISLALHRWGYETEINTAASIPGGAPVVPGPAGLFSLAIGAAGLRHRRQRIS